MSRYIIIGDNGEEYGPAGEEEIRHWITDRRVDAHTLIRREDASEWKPASEWPEFTQALSVFLLSAPFNPAQPRSSPVYAPRANVFATIGLTLGVLSLFTCCCPILPIPAVACSVIALIQIHGNPLQYSGKGAAIAGIALSLIGVGFYVLIQLSSASFDGFLDGLFKG